MTGWWERWRHGAPQLQLLFMLGGAALALAFLTVDFAVSRAVWELPASVVVRAVLIATIFLLPPTVIGLLVQTHQIELLTARLLLGSTIPEGAQLARWPQRVRACLWFWVHLIAGALVAAGGILTMIAAGQLATAPFEQPGHAVLGLGWLTVTGDGRDLLMLALVPVVIAVYVAGLAVCGQVLVTVAPVLIGPSYEERLQALEQSTARLIERNALARELHDSVGHALNAVVLQTALARRHVRSAPQRAEQELAAAGDAAGTALAELDWMLGLLRDASDRRTAVLADLGSVPELVRAAQAGSAGRVGLDNRIDSATVPATLSREAYRIVQESLTNAARHAAGTDVTVMLDRAGDRLVIEVRNQASSGRRRDPGRLRGGRGLEGMRERVRLLGGEFRAGLTDGCWEVRVLLPLPRTRPDEGRDSGE